MASLYLGIDLGGTDTKYGLIDSNGRVVRSAKNPTHSEEGYEAVLDRIARNAKDLMSGHGKITAVGMGCPGPLDSRKGIVYETPNLPGWENVPVQAILESKLDMPVTLNNDANAAAFGEFWVGAGSHTESMILFTLGTGVGGGIVLDGELYDGPDTTAGELGHMIINFDGPVCGCGNKGCIEAYASATAIRREVKEALEAGVETSIEIPDGAEDDFGAKVVYDAAVKGDKFAIELYEKVGFYLGVAAGSIVNIFNPEMIAYGGGLSNAGNFIFEPLKRTMKEMAFKKPAERCIITQAKLGNDAGIIGAAGLAMKRCPDK